MLCGAALSLVNRRVGAFVTSSIGRTAARSDPIFQSQILLPRPARRTLRLHALSQSPPDFTVVDDDDDNDGSEPPPTMSWRERNVAGRWESEGATDDNNNDDWFGDRRGSQKKQNHTQKRRDDSGSAATGRSGRNFREDFRGTRVFVQGLPLNASWQDLKDHFKIAGEVVFASVSIDSRTGESKGCGVVQFESTEMAKNAIRVMRNHPLDGQTLYVREDYQESRDDRSLSGRTGGGGGSRGDKLASIWKCADEDNAADLDDSERESILNLIKARDAARRRRNYDASDAMREELKTKFDVHLDDRLKLWWKSVDGAVPDKINDVKGDGRWGAQRAWSQIPTTPENDACVDPDLVNGLLKQRDIARKEKDFHTADSLLEQARTAPDGDLHLRIHDESRTWRIWTADPPPKPVRHEKTQEEARMDAREECLAIVEEYDPSKKEEVLTLLMKFKGREFTILKKLKDRYM